MADKTKNKIIVGALVFILLFVIAVTILLLRPTPISSSLELEQSKRKVEALEEIIKGKNKILNSRKIERDSIQALINTKNIEIKHITNLYYYEKSRIASLPIDSNIRILTNTLSEIDFN